MSGPTVLLIEDKADDEELALLAIDQLGMNVRVDVARDGEQAVRHLESVDGDRLPRLVLLDLKLPLLDGFEVLQRMRAMDHARLLPVVVLTSSDAPADVQRAYELGANGCVCKPLDFGRFSEVVRLLCEYWLTINVAAGRS